MTVVPFRIEHLARIRLQAAQRCCLGLMSEEMLDEIEQLEGYTGLVDDEPVAIAGVLEREPGVYAAWTFISEKAGRHMLAITRAVQRFLALKGYPEVEAYVDADFEAGHRWMQTLGFTATGPNVAAGRLQTRYVRAGVGHG